MASTTAGPASVIQCVLKKRLLSGVLVQLFQLKSRFAAESMLPFLSLLIFLVVWF